MTMAAGPGRYARREPETVIGEGPAGTARGSRQARRRRRAVWLRIGLGILRSRPFHVRVIVIGIGLAAILRIARESQNRNIARLIAWDRRQKLRRQRKAGRS
jgi:hypothetical protein